MPLRCLSVQHYERLFDDGVLTGGPTPFGANRVILFDPRIERGTQSIGERWRRLDVAKRAVDLVIVRGSTPDFQDAVEADTLLRDTTAGVPVVVLAGSWDAHDRAPRLSRPKWSSAPVNFPIDLDVLRTYELLTAVVESKAVYREANCHFRLPSSRFHAEAFIRLADALDDHTDLVRLSDWVLPYLEDRTALLGDNGSLVGLLSVARHEAHIRFGWRDVPVATLNEYPADTEAIRKFVEGFQAQDWDRLLFLITVSSSGSIADRVLALEGIDVEVVVLCGTEPDGVGPPLCFTRHLVERWEAGPDQSCDICPQRHCLIVDPETYEVRTYLSRERMKIDRAEAARCAVFWEAVDRTDAVRLHVEVPTAAGNQSGVRHLAVALDITALLGDDSFRAPCVAELRRQPSPDLALIPRHSATSALRDLVLEVHGPSVEVLDVPVGDFTPETVLRLEAASRVLVVDDVLITAETLAAFRRRIYETAGDVEVWGFTVVSRPPSRLELNHVKRPFYGPTTTGRSELRLGCGFDLFLPAPGQDTCPWCRERDLLNERLAGLPDDIARLAGERLDRLRMSDGLEAPLLLVGDSDATLTNGSYFGELRSKAAFAAASAVAQRQKDQFLRDRQVNEVRVFDVALALQAFFDPLFLAGLLRTFDRRDLRDESHDEEVDRALGEYQMFPGTLFEAGYAAVTGKVPADSMIRRLGAGGHDPVAQLMLALLKG
jgi:hypothetical protein